MSKPEIKDICIGDGDLCFCVGVDQHGTIYIYIFFNDKMSNQKSKEWVLLGQSDGEGHVHLVYKNTCHLVQYTCPIVLLLSSGL